MPKLIDIHCHLFECERELETISEIIHVSTALNQSEILFHQERNIQYWFAGLHPQAVKLSQQEINEYLLKLPYEQIIGLGEIGLDRNYPDKAGQLELLRKQLGIAKDLELPTLYHLVGRDYDFIKLHKKIKLENMKIMHGFNSSYEVFKELDKLAFYFSLSKRILANPQSRKTVKAILESKRFFLESDAPNHSGFAEVKIIARQLETDYNIETGELGEILKNNFNNLLKESCESKSKK